MYKAKIKAKGPIKNARVVAIDRKAEDISISEKENQDGGCEKQNHDLKREEIEIARQELMLRSKLYMAKRAEIQNLEKLSRLVQDVNENVGSLFSVLDDRVQEYQTKTVKLAVAIARKIISREINLDENILLDNLRNALHRVEDEKSIVIDLNPEDKTLLENLEEKIKEDVLHSEHVTLRSDPILTRGGFKISTSLGILDASLETQLQSIEELFNRS